MLDRVCFTEAEDELLARGWPRMVRLDPDHPHDKNPAKSALAWVAAIDPKYFSVWPREVAWRALRVGPVVRFAKTNYPQNALTKAQAETAAKAGAMSVDEAKRAMVDLVADFNEHSYQFKVREYVYLVETILGADATLEAIAGGFERSKPKTGSTQGTPMEMYTKTYVASTIAFLLLRASPKVKSKVTKRLEAQSARFADIAKKDSKWNWCAEYLDVSLHGAAGVKRMMTGRVNVELLEYAADDPDYVRACLAKEPKQGMSPRIVKIAGLETLKGLSKRKFSSPELPGALRDLGMIRAPEVVDFVLSIVGKSSVKDGPINWLVAHADYAKPIVERAAKGGSATAKAALGRMRA